MIVSVNDSVLLSAQLSGRPTTAGVRARVLDSSNNPVVGSPFTLSHVNQGLYTSRAWTPTALGQYVVRFEVYTDNTFATPDSTRDWVIEDVNVVKRSGLAGEVDKGL